VRNRAQVPSRRRRKKQEDVSGSPSGVVVTDGTVLSGATPGILPGPAGDEELGQVNAKERGLTSPIKEEQFLGL